MRQQGYLIPFSLCIFHCFTLFTHSSSPNTPLNSSLTLCPLVHCIFPTLMIQQEYVILLYKNATLFCFPARVLSPSPISYPLFLSSTLFSQVDDRARIFYFLLHQCCFAFFMRPLPLFSSRTLYSYHSLSFPHADDTAR